MLNPRLESAFRGQLTRLVGAFQATEGSPSASAGSLRESELRGAISRCLPGGVRVTSGTVIDTYARQTGQLDGIVVDATGIAIAFSDNDPSAPVLAEGVVAVVEAKSDLAKQWSQIPTMLDGLRPIRRRWVGGAMVHAGGPPADGLPLVLLGWKGWQGREHFVAHAAQLASADHGRTLMIQLEPAMVAMVTVREGRPHVLTVHIEPAESWRTVEILWRVLASESQRRVRLSAPYDWYVGEPEVGVPLQG